MQHYWIFIAGLMIAETGYFYHHPWVATGVIVLLLGRIWATKRLMVLAVALSCLLVFASWLVYERHQLTSQQISLFQTTTVTDSWRVYPDQVSVTGTQGRALGENLTTHERCLLSVTLRSPTDLNQIQRMRRPQIWRLTGEKSSIFPATNVGEFDRRQYYLNRRIVNQIKSSQLPQRLPDHLALGWRWVLGELHAWRQVWIRSCEQLPGALQVYALGLLPGAKGPTSATELNGIRQLGLLHLFCISGMHVGLFFTAIEWGAAHLRLRRDWYQWGLLAALPIYFVLAGSGIGLLRACLAYGLQLLMQRCRLPLASVDVWAWSLILGLFMNPGIAFELGAQLSYGLSLALIFLKHQSAWFKDSMLTLVGLPLIFNGVFQWHLLSLLANWVVVPLFSVIIVPLTLLGWLLYPTLPIVSQVIATFFGFFDTSLTMIAHWPGQIVMGKPPTAILMVILLLTWGLMAVGPQRCRSLLIVLCGVYLCCYGIIHFPLDGEVTFIDVGQGDSILLRSPGNQQVSLIDTGGHLRFPAPAWANPVPSASIAERITVPFLHSRGINHLHTVYLSHHDVDHMGELPVILANFTVDQIVVPQGMLREPAFRRFCLQYPGNYHVVGITTAQRQINGFEIKHPFVAMPADNGGSVALRGSFGGLTFMFMGDLDQAGEHRILKAGLSVKADVIKLGHHGSKTATASDFLWDVHPRLAIISAGRQNRYGHPNTETLQTLKQQAIPWMSTQTAGMIQYRYRGHQGHWTRKLE